jgi:hypothetical protein
MANAFKLKQDMKKQADLIEQCMALSAQGPVGKRRAIST